MYSDIYTDKIKLRKFSIKDAATVKHLADNELVADTCLLPNPYSLEMAESWINSHTSLYIENRHHIWAICCDDSDSICGSIGLHNAVLNSVAEFGFWLGFQYWNKGIATIATEEVIKFGFKELNLMKIYAQVFTRNVASARVLEKNGFHREALLQNHIFHRNQFENIYIYSIFNQNYKQT